MKTNDQIQKEFSKVEQELLEARLKFRDSSNKSSQYEEVLEKHKKALQQLEKFEEGLDGTVCFIKSTYSVRCKSCGETIRVSCTKPPEMYECNFCGETSQIKYKIIKNASY